MTDPLDILFENLLEHLDENLPRHLLAALPAGEPPGECSAGLPDPGADRTAGVLSGRRLGCTEQEERFLFRSGFPPGPGAVTPSRRASSPLTRPSFWPRSFCWMWSWPPLWRPSPSWPQASLRQSWRLPVSWRRSFSRRSWRCPPSSLRLSAWRASSPLSPPPQRQTPAPSALSAAFFLG